MSKRPRTKPPTEVTPAPNTEPDVRIIVEVQVTIRGDSVLVASTIQTMSDDEALVAAVDDHVDYVEPYVQHLEQIVAALIVHDHSHAATPASEGPPLQFVNPKAPARA